MIRREKHTELKELMDTFPAVALLGPRQVGKTTLALEIAKDFASVYLDLESAEDRAKLASPAYYLENHKDKLIILDEVQRIPGIFEELRGIIDKNRRAGHTSGQFLFLGSASIDLLKQSGETLAGRIAYCELSPITVAEYPEDMDRLWLRGGFPDSLLASNDKKSLLWRSSFIRTYLERDIPQLGPRIPAETLRRFWMMLAHLQGSLLNASHIAASLGVDGKTVMSYLDLMVDLLLVQRLTPLHKNLGKRLIKSPKVYIRDSGLLHALLGIDNQETLLRHPIIGMSWEGFVIENIFSVLPNQAEAYFYRTAAGAEIDLLLKLSSRELWAIEIKNSVAPKVKKGFHLACEDVKATRKFVVYGGTDEFPIGNGTVVIALKNLLTTLQEVA